MHHEILSGVTSSYAQERSNSQPRNKVVRKSGWRVPGLNEFVIVSGTKRINVDGVEVVAKTHGITGEHEPLVDFEGFVAQTDGSIVINNGLSRVRNFASYEARGQTFAYKIALQPVEVDVQGNRTYFGVLHIVYYSDEDGNGSFETRYNLREGGTPILPAWVRKQSR
jgi:hypothetical protein